MSDLMKKVAEHVARMTPEQRAEIDRRMREREAVEESPTEWTELPDGRWMARKGELVGIGNGKEEAFKDLFAKIQLHFCPPGKEWVLRRSE